MIDWKTIELGDLAGFLSKEFKSRGIDTVLVGGACVTIYSQNRYQSCDLDFVTYEDIKILRNVLSELGFVEKEGCFQHPECKWFVEFVTPPVAVGNESIDQFEEIDTPLGTIKMLRPEDSVKDRLASYFYWNDRQGLNQAVEICKDRNIDYKEIEQWATNEKHEKRFQDFLTKLKMEKIL